MIDFLLRSDKLSSGDLVALKQKVASIRAKEKSENSEIVKQNIGRINEVIQSNNSEVLNSNNLDTVVNTMIANYSPTRLHRLFKHSSSKELSLAINEAYEADLEEESSRDYRLQNSGYIMNEIDTRKSKVYEHPTRISEDVHAAILKLLSARNDEEFLAFIQDLFQTIFIIEQRFENIIEKKDEEYKEHTSKMNQIFNRSQSESSEDYDRLL